MNFRFLSILAAVAIVGQATLVSAQSPSTVSGKSAATHHAKGTFEVNVKPVPLADAEAGKNLGRMTLEKKFSGDLTGTGKGEMLTASSPDGSGAYVAIEQVTGTLDGRKGSFVLQHSGTMNSSMTLLTIMVVQGSGTGELAGLAGSFQIKIAGGQHSYDFEYTLP